MWALGSGGARWACVWSPGVTGERVRGVSLNPLRDKHMATPRSHRRQSHTRAIKCICQKSGKTRIK